MSIKTIIAYHEDPSIELVHFATSNVAELSGALSFSAFLTSKGIEFEKLDDDIFLIHYDQLLSCHDYKIHGRYGINHKFCLLATIPIRRLPDQLVVTLYNRCQACFWQYESRMQAIGETWGKAMALLDSDGVINSMRPKEKAEKLLNGEVIISKEPGNSMTPILKSRQPVELTPISWEHVKKGDIVYCKVKGNYYTHLVKATNKKRGVLIGNNHGKINGWTKKIFGKVTKIYGR